MTDQIESNNINTGHGSLALVVLKIDADIDVDIQSIEAATYDMLICTYDRLWQLENDYRKVPRVLYCTMTGFRFIAYRTLFLLSFYSKSKLSPISLRTPPNPFSIMIRSHSHCLITKPAPSEHQKIAIVNYQVQRSSLFVVT